MLLDFQIFHNVPWTLLYADDILREISTRDPQPHLQSRYGQLNQFGLRLNIRKTELPKSLLIILYKSISSPRLTNYRKMEILQVTRKHFAWYSWKQLTGFLCNKCMPINLKYVRRWFDHLYRANNKIQLTTYARKENAYVAKFLWILRINLQKVHQSPFFWSSL